MLQLSKHLSLTALLFMGAASSAWAASAVSVRENDSLPIGARCPISNVYRLDPKGDGFLSVRSGPGAGYAEIGRLHNGDLVFVVEERGSWLGIYFGVKEAACNGPLTGPAVIPKQGWVTHRFIEAD